MCELEEPQDCNLRCISAMDPSCAMELTYRPFQRLPVSREELIEMISLERPQSEQKRGDDAPDFNGTECAIKRGYPRHGALSTEGEGTLNPSARALLYFVLKTHFSRRSEISAQRLPESPF